jgi:hypothetical protein
MTYRLIRRADMSEKLPHELGVTNYIWRYKDTLLRDTVNRSFALFIENFVLTHETLEEQLYASQKQRLRVTMPLQ